MGAFTHEAVAADPLGRRLYLTEDTQSGRFYISSQRGTDGRGITYEVTGPFRTQAA